MEPKRNTSMYSRAVGVVLLLAFLVALSSILPATVAVYTATAGVMNFDPVSSQWIVLSNSCGLLDATTRPLAFRERHPWTQFCGSLGPYRGDHGCWLCLNVTNLANLNSVTVRIVDIGDPQYDQPLMLDSGPFTTIADGQGAAAGQLDVMYDLTECGDGGYY